jgi:putative redox protein
MKSEKREFPGYSGEMLAARLDRPAGVPRAYALFAHCFTCGKDIFAASRISAALVEHGFAVLRFDFTGLGMSEGEFANTNFSSNVADLVKAADYLRAEYAAPTLLIGHSLGGPAVLAAAGGIDETKAVVTIGAPAEPIHVEKQLDDNLEAIREQGELEVKLAGRPFRIKKQFLEDLEASTIRRRVETLRRALLVMHSPVDNFVNVDNAREIYQAAKHPKSFISLDDADHLLTKRSDAEYTASVLAAWAQRYLPQMDEAEPLEDGQVEVSETGTGKLANQVRAGRHVLAADEPKRLGGTNTGPTPYDYLLAGLGACTAMTLRLYAERKELALDKVSVRLHHQRIHADDCSDCESAGARLARCIATSDWKVICPIKIAENYSKSPINAPCTRHWKTKSRFAHSWRRLSLHYPHHRKTHVT